MQSKKCNFYAVIICSFAICLTLAFGILAWTEPNSIPPSNNIAAPINTSSILQNKIGDLLIGNGLKISSLGTAFALKTNTAPGTETINLIVGQDGHVGIGTTAPQKNLEVVGDAQATNFCLNGECCDNWDKCAEFAARKTIVNASVTSITDYTLFDCGTEGKYWCPSNYCFIQSPKICTDNGYLLVVYTTTGLISTTCQHITGNYWQAGFWRCQNGQWVKETL